MEGKRFLHKLRLSGLLSFDPEGVAVELGPLNVLIGPNASGKSNLIEAIGLLKAAPTDLAAAIRKGGGIGEWLWKGGDGGPDRRDRGRCRPSERRPDCSVPTPIREHTGASPRRWRTCGPRGVPNR